ncbi:hypothetical protein V6N13_125159 [Hibiscus sabdariffa]
MPVYVDAIAAGRYRVSFAKVCIEISTDFQIPKTIEVHCVMVRWPLFVWKFHGFLIIVNNVLYLDILRKSCSQHKMVAQIWVTKKGGYADLSAHISASLEIASNATTVDPTISDFVVIIEDVLPIVVIDNVPADVIVVEPMVANVFALEIVLLITNSIVFEPIIPATSAIAPGIDVSTVPNVPAKLVREASKGLLL